MTDHARRFDPKRLSAHSDPVNMSPEYVENLGRNRHIEYEFAEEYTQGDDHHRVVAREINEPWVVE